MANKTSRQMMPTKTKAGGDSASNRKSASQEERRATVNATTAKVSQYSVTVSSRKLPGPGAIGSTSDHSTIITGDCQSPNVPLAMSL